MQFNPKPSDYYNLLEVFRTGLLYKLVTKEHVTHWADSIVKAAHEPAYFFIELSLAKDKNEIFEIIGNDYAIKSNVVTTRALFGIIYHKISDDTNDIKSTIGVLDILNNRDILTEIESAFIYELSDEFDETVSVASKERVNKDILKFLSVYHDFNVDNYRAWEEISERLHPLFVTIETGLKDDYKQAIREQRWSSFKEDLTKIVIGLILFACAGFIFYSDSLMHPGSSDGSSDGSSSNSSIWSKFWMPIVWVVIWIGKWIYSSFAIKVQPRFQTKTELRTEYLLKRQSLADDEYTDLNQQLLTQFQQLDFSAIKCIHFFLPIVDNNEVNTCLLRDWLKQTHPEIKVVHPKTNFRTLTMKSYAYDDDLRIETSRYGIPEPTFGNEVEVAEIDLVILPMLIFDELGYRVGYGKGFYDRFCALCKPGTKFIGLSLFNPVASIEGVDQYDVWMHACLTPTDKWAWQR